MRSQRITPFISILTVIFAVWCAAPGHCAEPKSGSKSVLVIAPTFNIQGAGISIESIQQIGENLIKKLEARTGIKLEYEMVGDNKTSQKDAMEMAIERLKTRGDISWTDYTNYIKAKEMGIPLDIIALIEIDGSINFTNCIYALKDSPYKNLEKLRGKVINGGPNLDWVGLRMIMYEYGIDEPPDKFFSELIPMSTLFGSFNGVILKKLDAFVLQEPVFNILKRSNEKYEKIEPMVCAESSPTTLLPVYREGIDKKVLDTFRELLLNVQNDPDMGAVKPFLEAAKIRFVAPTKQMLADIDKNYRLAEKNKWFKEQDKYLEDFKEVARKKAAEKCKKKCTGSTPEEVKKCISKCESKFESED